MSERGEREREQTRKISLVLKLEHLVFSLDFRAGRGAGGGLTHSGQEWAREGGSATRWGVETN